MSVNNPSNGFHSLQLVKSAWRVIHAHPIFVEDALSKRRSILGGQKLQIFKRTPQGRDNPDQAELAPPGVASPPREQSCRGWPNVANLPVSPESLALWDSPPHAYRVRTAVAPL